MTHWERLPPEKPCSHPDGHNPMDLMLWGSEIPERVFCQRCGRGYTVIVLPGERQP